jgi:hypothetical protein
VPVALNADRLPDTHEGRFFRGLMKQWPQGLWVVTSAGKVLGFHYHKAKPGETYAEGQMVRDALKDAGPLAPRDLATRPDPSADRGRGVASDGGVRLAVGVIGLRNGRQEGPPVVDSIHLTAGQWAAFGLPEGEPKAGSRWEIPEDAARRFAPALSPMTDSIFAPKPDDVTKVKLTATVERVADGYAVIRYAGSWETAHDRDGDPKFPIRTAATGEGVGVYDTKTGRLRAVAWLLSGTFRNSPPADRPQPTAAIVEWSEGDGKR